jgi:creatinine amidohydrolase
MSLADQRKVWLSDMTWREVPEVLAKPNVVLVPTGAVEQHGPHLPMDTDIRIASEFCAAAATRVGDDCNAVVVPPMPFGISEHHMAFPGTMALTAETFIAVIYEVTDSLVRHGFERFILVNGHGGNQGALQIIAQKLRLRSGAKHVFYFNEWALARDAFARLRDSPPGGTSHACEYETSVYLHLAPERVQFERAVREIPDSLVEGGLVELFLPGPYSWAPGQDISKSGVEGDPTLATAEKGEELVEAAVSNLADLARAVAVLGPADPIFV